AKADPAAADEEGVTPASLAAENGHAGVLRLLQEAGADLAAVAKDGTTPAHAAAFAGHLEALRLLLEAKADPAAADEEGWTPASLAAQNGHAGVLRLLQEAGADLAAAAKDGRTPAHQAAGDGHAEALRVLLEATTALPQDEYGECWGEHCKDLRSKSPRPAEDKRKGAEAPLFDPDTPPSRGKAWFWTHTAGADLQARTQLGDTPLTLAVAEGRAAAVSFLLEARADANALGACDAENACDLAERRGDEDLVSVLRAAGEVPTSARTWLTSGARDLAKGQGKWYHEVLLRGRFREPQIGWLSARFQEGERDGNGVGDDADGWAFDGERCKQWHAGHTSEAGTVVEEECKGYASFSLRASARQPSLRGDPATSSAAAPDLPWTSTVEQCACRIKAFGIPRYPAVSISGFFSMAISKKVDTGATELLVIAS
ncbi:ANKK1, partial [Symbiodinium sp. KB8]